MATVTELKRERRIPDDQMDDVIARAARLQEQARAGARDLTVAEVKEVGQELDIDPRFVDVALAELERERAEAAVAKQRARTWRLRLAAAGGAVIALLLVVAWSGAGGVRAAERRAEAAGTALTTVLDRQARLLPQLLALAGGASGELASHQRRLADARTLAERAAAADALAAAMATAVGRLPASRDPSQAQMRLSLQHELVGAQNRLTVEHRRYHEARAAWRAAVQGPAARLAVLLGFAAAP
jgi:LemA protein